MQYLYAAADVAIPRGVRRTENQPQGPQGRSIGIPRGPRATPSQAVPGENRNLGLPSQSGGIPRGVGSEDEAFAAMQRELEEAQRGGEGPATVAYDPDDVGGWDPGVDAGVPLGRQGGQRAPAAPSGPPQGRIVGGFGGKPQGRTGGREQSTDISSRQKQYLLQDEEGGPFYSAPLPAGFKWALDDVGPVDPARPPLRPLIAANTPIHEIIAKSAELRAARQQEEGGGFRSANPRQKPMFSSDLKEPLAELEIDGRVPSATLDRDVFLRDANGQSLRTSMRALLSGVLSRDDSGVLLGQLPASRQADVLNAAIELGQARGFDQRFDGGPSDRKSVV